MKHFLLSIAAAFALATTIACGGSAGDSEVPSDLSVLSNGPLQGLPDGIGGIQAKIISPGNINASNMNPSLIEFSVKGTENENDEMDDFSNCKIPYVRSDGEEEISEVIPSFEEGVYYAAYRGEKPNRIKCPIKGSPDEIVIPLRTDNHFFASAQSPASLVLEVEDSGLILNMLNPLLGNNNLVAIIEVPEPFKDQIGTPNLLLLPYNSHFNLKHLIKLFQSQEIEPTGEQIVEFMSSHTSVISSFTPNSVESIQHYSVRRVSNVIDAFSAGPAMPATF